MEGENDCDSTDWDVSPPSDLLQEEVAGKAPEIVIVFFFTDNQSGNNLVDWINTDCRTGKV